MAGMPNPIETSTSTGGAAKFFKFAESWLNDSDPAKREQHRIAALASVANFQNIQNAQSQGAGGLQHFNQHWRAGPAGWWPNISASRVNSQMGAAFTSALNRVLTPGNQHLDIRLLWDCTNLDLNAYQYFYASTRETGSELWIDIRSPRAPGRFAGRPARDPESGRLNYGDPTLWPAGSGLDRAVFGPFAALGRDDVVNYDGWGGTGVSFDAKSGEERPEFFRESWSLFPTEQVKNGSNVLAGLRYTRDSWRRTPDKGEAPAVEDELLHSETGYLLWDAENGRAYRIIALPRGVSLLAVAIVDDWSDLTFVASSEESREEADGQGGILSNPVLNDAVHTVRFVSNLKINGNGDSFSYTDTAEQRLGTQEPVEHTSSNSVERV